MIYEHHHRMYSQPLAPSYILPPIRAVTRTSALNEPIYSDAYIIDRVIEGAVDRLTRLITARYLEMMDIRDQHTFDSKKEQVTNTINNLATFLTKKARQELKQEAKKATSQSNRYLNSVDDATAMLKPLFEGNNRINARHSKEADSRVRAR